jgi:hypothetical protein
MRVIRSFPKVIPPGRAYVQDDLERFYMSEYDYQPLAEFAFGDDILLLEWDIAVSKYDLQMFIGRAHVHGDVIVAPYDLTTPGTVPHWNLVNGQPERVTRDDDECDYFGLGMVYLPNYVLTGYPKGNPMTDGTLSRWYHKQYNKRVPIDWGTRVVHLH